MRERISGNTKADIFSFDFRIRTDDKTNEGGIASLWLWSVVGDGVQLQGANCSSFVDWFLERSDEENVCLYCFDLGLHWSFIVYELFKRGYRFASRLRKDSRERFNSFCRGSGSVVYSAMLKKERKAGYVFFKDLKQVYAGYRNLDQMAASFKSGRRFFPDDLEKEHPEGERPTPEEAENSLSRAGFVFDVLKRQEDDPSFFQSYTLASHSIRRAILHAFGHLQNPYMGYRSPKMYPSITDKEEKAALRLSIKGGLTGPTLTAIDRDYEINEEIFFLDRTQSYPSEMKMSKLPRGRGERFDGFKVGGGFRLYQVRINSFDGVRFHSIPSLMQAHLHFKPEGSAPLVLWLWEWEYWQAYRCYINLSMDVLGGYLYKKGICPFGRYVEENQKKRREFETKGDHIQAAHLKALNVSLYGKLIQRESKETTEQDYDEETGFAITQTKTRKKGKESSYSYLPAGSAIPSLARYHLVEMAEEFGFDNIVYVETDSLVVIANKKTKKILRSMELKNELGGWHLESKAVKAYFPMAKRYKYLTDEGKTVVKGAGIDPEAWQGEYEETVIMGTDVVMRMKKPAKGGTLLVKVKKHLKEEENTKTQKK